MGASFGGVIVISKPLLAPKTRAILRMAVRETSSDGDIAQDLEKLPESRFAFNVSELLMEQKTVTSRSSICDIGSL
jgi:hypothetical protein